MSSKRNKTRRRAYTLLELVMTSGLMAMVLVPALALMRDAVELSTTAETWGTLTTYGVDKIEEHLVLAAAGFQDASVSGNFSADGRAELRYVVVRSQSPVSGGITNRLMTVIATVWSDENGNNLQDAGEPSITLSSKIAKVVSYENEANK